MNINILTYNTSWKSTKPPKINKDFGKLGDKCIANADECRNNIRSIIFDKSKQYDFIGLQEFTNELLNITDEDNSIEYTKQFEEYTLISRGVNIKNLGIVRAALLYNNLKYHPIYTLQGSVYSSKLKDYEKGRLFIATLFQIINTNEVILVINCHFPHDNINNPLPFKYIQDEIKVKFDTIGIKINKNTPFIIMGDFNRNLNDIKPPSSFTFLDQPLLFNNILKTCCTTDDIDRINKLEAVFDNIIFNKKFYKEPKYDVIDLYPASDHFALNASTEFKNISLTSSSNKPSVPSTTNDLTNKMVYGGKKYKIYTGLKGGKYIFVNNKKKYV
jgi:endonuclease/exonuclease/phosphatase family metal-dependent hydrolase